MEKKKKRDIYEQEAVEEKYDDLYHRPKVGGATNQVSVKGATGQKWK